MSSTKEIVSLDNIKEVLKKYEKGELNPIFAVAIMKSGEYNDPTVTEDKPKQYTKK